MKNVTLFLIDNNMDIRNFILHQKFENIDKEIERIERERQNNGFNLFTISLCRSEERRVGKECRSRWSPYH